MNEYVFLVRFGTQATLTPSQQKANTEGWNQLIQQWKQQNKFVGSTLITKPGFVVDIPEQPAHQGFMADAAYRIVSIIRVLAGTVEEAVEMANRCPTLEFGGTVEVREVQPSPFL